MSFIQWLKKIFSKPLPKPIPVPVPIDTDDYINRLLELHNEARKDYDLPPLNLNVNLCNAALVWAKEMNQTNVLSHSPSWPQRIVRNGYKFLYAGENIGIGQSADSVFNNWFNNDSANNYKHRENILSDNFSDVGFARIGSFWVVDFGHK